jgi:hypothetical protein
MKKQFNLEAALNGEPFECEDGSQVLKWMYCEEIEMYNISCYIRKLDGKVELVFYTKDGFFFFSGDKHPLNLVMSPKKITRWFNVYESAKDEDGFILGGHRGYETEEEASQPIYSKNKGYIKTIPIEIELP